MHARPEYFRWAEHITEFLGVHKLQHEIAKLPETLSFNLCDPFKVWVSEGSCKQSKPKPKLTAKTNLNCDSYELFVVMTALYNECVVHVRQ